MNSVLIHDEAELAPHLAGWDRLAVLRRQPYSAPAWMLAWWRNVAPPGARLAVVVARDGDEVVGVAPFYRVRTRTGLWTMRLLGTGHRVEPLAGAGRDAEVAESVVAALRGASPRPGALRLDRADARSPWPTLLSYGWPGRSRVSRRRPVTAPTLTIGGRSYDEWLATRSGNFRSQRKRTRRKLAERGAVARLVGPDDDLEAAVEGFMRVHEARWSSRGESSSLGAGIGRMLLEAGRELVPSDRMRLWLLEADGAPVSAQVFLVAGGEVAYWNGGFDPAWSDLRPAFETLGYAVEHAFGQGDLRVDFGGGSNPYKDRLADGDHPIGPAMVLPGGPDLPVRAAQLLPERLRRSAASAAKRLPDDLQERLRALVRRH